ncbi:glycosyltransferase family 4 protein [Marinobacter sp.]|uniref:glycosyltransferase family 4 protein n=1 Tax=Marinobacter sp. TaxID=50741 RepID=UPI0034A1B4F6
MNQSRGNTILHLIDTTGPGGAETVFISLLSELQNTSFRNVVVLRGEGWVAEQVRSLGIAPYIIDSKGSFNLGYISALWRLVSTQGVDLIHAHLLGSNVYGAMVSVLSRTPMIATFHGAVDVASGERFLKAKFALIGWGASAIVSVSRRLQQELGARAALPAHKLQLVYNGVDPDRFTGDHGAGLRSELGLPPNGILVVSIGNIRPAKGYEYLVDAAITLSAQHPDIHFVVVGHQKEPLFSALKAQVSESPRAPNIHWLGFRQDVSDVLRQGDIFLLPSVSEGFSIATVEAMMAGIPVIATRSGGPEEIIEDGETGYLIPVRDSEAIVSAILELRQPARAEPVVGRARNRAVEQFSLAAMLNQYMAVYKRLIRPKGSA